MSAMPKAVKPARFVEQQLACTAYIRDPGHNAPPPGTDPRRMAAVAELFYNNIDDTLSSAFPVLRRISSDSYWHGLVRDFYARHHCHTPLFSQIAGEFLDYLANEREPHPEDPAFLLELAHYEWVELALSIAEEEPNGIDANLGGDLLREHPQLSPLAWPLSYRFAVQRIGPTYQPEESAAQATYLLVYRDRRYAIGFMELNPISTRLLTLLEEQPHASGRTLLECIAEETGHHRPEVLIQGGLSMLQELQQRDVILGTRPATDKP